MQLNQYFKLIRIHQPAGIFLLLWPCLWGVALARGVNDTVLIILFILGSIVMRGAGCIVNDLVDIDIDKNVARTKHRPLASGVVTRSEALLILCFLLLIGVLILLYFNKIAIMISLFSIVLAAVYPLMKRITYWPQLFLGFTFNIGILIGYAQIMTKIDINALLLYIAGVFWTLGYDTIYGYQDIKDDLKIGVKSSSIAIKKFPKSILALIYSLMILFIILSLKNKHILTYCFMFPPTVILFWQVLTLKTANPQNCLIRFKSNIFVGLLIFGALLVAPLS